MERNEETLEIGTLVKWNEFPDRIYFISEEPKWFCGRLCYRIESVDHKWVALVGEEDLEIL